MFANFNANTSNILHFRDFSGKPFYQYELRLPFNNFTVLNIGFYDNMAVKSVKIAFMVVQVLALWL